LSILKHISKTSSKVFRRAYIKRRDRTTGLFETNWQEITDDVKRWGKYKLSVDDIRYSKFMFNNAVLTVSNDEGKYSPHIYNSSLWWKHAPIARSLLKIEAGYYTETSSGEIWTRTEYPTDPTMFIGVLQGDAEITERDEVQLRANSQMNVLRDFPGENLRGFTTTGQTASKAVEAIRDMTDGSGNYLFLPYFDDDANNWVVSTTTQDYDNLNTGAAQDIRDISAWEVIEKLAEAENKVTYIDRTGKFYFVSRGANDDTTTAFHFYGNVHNSTYGQTIKKVDYLKDATDKFYSRIKVKFSDEDTIESYVVTETTMAVSGVNDAWLYGQQEFELANYWIAGTAAAQTIAEAIHSEVSTVKKEVGITTSFIPQLGVFDPVQVTYYATETDEKSLWDCRNWADDTAGEDLYWAKDDAWDIDSKEFMILSVELDLDNFSSTFKLRET